MSCYSATELRTVLAGDTDEASRSTLDSSWLLGLDVLCDSRHAFVSCTHDTLIKGLVTLLPATLAIVEILESVPADPDVLAACQKLKQQGYMIAVDDYVAGDPGIVGRDRRHHQGRNAIDGRGGASGPDRTICIAPLPNAGGKDRDSRGFLRARDQGFVYFQGYFFPRPEMSSTRDMPAHRLHYLRMLQEVSRPELDLAELETLIKAEASVFYRLLRYLSSAMSSFSREIHSVKHALSLLGEHDVRRWVRLVAAVGAGQDKTSDLVLSALVRGRFGELLAPSVEHREPDLFLLGLLSSIDAMLEMPMESVLERISLDHETKAVLLGRASALRPVYQLMLAHESGEWEAAAELSAGLHLDNEQVAGYNWQAEQWARGI